MTNKKLDTQTRRARSGPGIGFVTDLSEFLKPADAASAESGIPLVLDLELIEEDPDQPRTVFDEKLLQDMATTIAARGVKNPISVRQHPTKAGYYVINDGARRYRASRKAGQKTIPVIVDGDFTKIDQIVVNAHHETFTPREWAIIIDQELKKGKKKSEIADELGMSRSAITHFAALLHLPDPIASLFNSGRFVDPTGLNELVVMWNIDPAKVESWLADETLEITRAAVRNLHRFMDAEAEASVEADSPEETYEKVEEAPDNVQVEKKAKSDTNNKLRKAIIQVQYKGREAQLQAVRRPTKKGLAWLKYDDDGKVAEVALAQVKLVAILEG